MTKKTKPPQKRKPEYYVLIENGDVENATVIDKKKTPAAVPAFNLKDAEQRKSQKPGRDTVQSPKNEWDFVVIQIKEKGKIAYTIFAEHDVCIYAGELRTEKPGQREDPGCFYVGNVRK